jgi:signal recognition particle receptor subunit beta
MALVNQAKQEINAKIVFFGPGLAGKASNLKHVYNKLKPEFRGAMKAMNVQDARMLFFDFTPPGEGNVEGFRVRFHVYTVSGSAVEPAAWKMVLKGVDGVVFVADSAPERQAANRESLESLEAFLKGYGQTLASIPVVYQFNKSDLPDALPVADLDRMFNPSRQPSFKASSRTGEGVLQTLLGLVKTVLVRMRDKGLEGIGSGEALQAMVQAQAAPAVPAAGQAETAALSEVITTHQQQAAAVQAPQAPAAPAPQAAASAPVEAAPAQSLQAQVADQALSLEVAGAPEAAGPGQFRLPLTIRSGERSKSVVLTLAISLEEV